MVTVNGDKVTHGHAYQSKTNPEDWYFTAKINGEQLKPQKMDPALGSMPSGSLNCS